VLLVAPAPDAVHQAISARLITALTVGAGAAAFVFGPGAIAFPPRTQLEPDILVLPAKGLLTPRWQDYTEHWLAAEVLSPSSRLYDRDFKRDAYLALGVLEVWLIDRDDRSVEISRANSARVVVRDWLEWRVPTSATLVRISLVDLFAGIG